MPRCLACWTVVVLGVAFWCAEASAADAKVEGEIRQAIATLGETFNRGDAKAMADCWAADGEFISPQGERLVGREKIAAAFREYFGEHSQLKLQLSVAAVRMLGDGIALVDLVGQMAPDRRGVKSTPFSSVVMVRQDGRWLIGRIHEAADSRKVHHDHLKDLSWLVGVWGEEIKHGDTVVSIQTDCQWIANGNYLIRKFAVEGRRGVVMGGSEVIGWDPRTHRIRSWTFNSDGSFGESVWTPEDDNQWVVRYTATTEDGGDLSATHVMTVVDANTITFQSKNRMVNGVRKPDLPEVTLKRRQAEESSPKKPAQPQRVLPKAS
ncbi:MAG: SgcJ/EcaC family oxidoreductase [Planctomycetaceae bacterium]|nr:SgcJ/EcaC family oxidoreductase [Planctomycetaceae bacterium]